jgi:hypothetical protein
MNKPLADKLCEAIATAVARVRDVFEAEQPAETATPVAPVHQERSEFYFDIFA